MSQRIRIKLQSYDHNLVDKSAEKIVKTVRSTGAVITGPIPLPTQKRIFTVLKSPHVNKKAREQFQLCTHKRLLDIYTSSSRTVDALSKLDLPSGVDVEIKAWWGLGVVLLMQNNTVLFHSSPNWLPLAWEKGALKLIFSLKREFKYKQALRGLFTIGTSILTIREKRKRSIANWDWSEVIASLSI